MLTYSFNKLPHNNFKKIEYYYFLLITKQILSIRYLDIMSRKLLSRIKELGIKEAQKSPIHNKFCAFLIHRNKIISYGYNTYKGPLHHNNKQCILCSQQIHMAC
jgi:hypothetical protein